MRGSLAGVAVAALVVAACSSDDSSGSSSGAACGDIAGNYRVASSRSSGTCDASIDNPSFSISFVRGADGTWNAAYPGITGGCPGTLEGCKFTSACEVRAADGSTVASGTISYQFTGSGFTGTTVMGLRPPAVAAACDAAYSETGTRL